MKNLILIGPPGSGKGTQSAYLVKNYNYIQVSTGDMLREAVKQKNDFADELKKIIDAGVFVSDKIILEMISKKIVEIKDKNFAGIIFDGFPRNISQAEELDKLLSHNNLAIDVVIEVEVEKEILIKRIAGRYSCTNCNEGYNKYFKKPLTEGVCDVCGGTEFTHRNDDNEEVVSARLKIYEESTKPLVEYYKERKVLKKIDGSSEVDLVTNQINLILNNL